MLGPSRIALAESRDALVDRAGDPAFAGLSGDLLAVAALLGRETGLRTTLADAGQREAGKAAVVQQVLGGRVSALAVAVVTEVAARRWSSGRDLVDAVEYLGVEAAFVVAEREGRLDQVEDEIFRFARTVEAQPALRRLLTDPLVEPGVRAAVLSDLLAGQAAPETLRLASHLATNLRGRRLEAALGELVQQAARRRERLLAEVRVAAALSPEQHDRLAAALGRIYGRPVGLQVEVDPAVLGGAVVRVGDEIIDGSVAHRLAEVSRRIAG